ISSKEKQPAGPGSQTLVGIARAFPTRQRLNENAPLARYVQSTLQTFDFFAVHGSILVSLQDTIVERANHGVKFRVLLMDHGDANVQNLKEYGRVQFPATSIERLQQMPGESIDVLKSIHQRIDNASGGSFEFRFVPFQFLNSFWVRDAGYPSALAHLEITAYRPTNPNITNPSVRFGALCPEMIESLHLQFEGLWPLGTERQSLLSAK
ncbi:MAG TPA: hypothetical protein VHX65_03280, partial [Pirellulales bacterium]|nr:hypothetical protein [Pirellulales bacterium]